MFDERTAAILRKAPELPGLAANDLPQILTRQYARLVSRRLRGDDPAARGEEEWPLDRIADVYEIVASVETETEQRSAAAFVAGTAQQIIARRAAASAASSGAVPQPVDRNSVDASIAAPLLFLAAEQYADAYEASGPIAIPREGIPEALEFARHVRDLARGTVAAILERTASRRDAGILRDGRPLEASALRLLLDRLALGIERLAAFVLAEGASPAADLRSARSLFEDVLRLSAGSRQIAFRLSGGGDDPEDARLRTYYPGPAHLASLLLSVADGIEQAPLTAIPPPRGADEDFWRRWLAFRASRMPFVWRNHREAIARNFHETGTSAVLVLPTGAGKTTVSVLKIAGVLARGKKVVFLAPTHALVEQLTEDLQALFPEDEFSLQVSGDFDSLLVDDTQLRDIEVMTPERCLSMLSFAPQAFANVGLLVFDECHLLNPPPNRKIGRALDSMLCLLAFQATVPDSDLLLLSAMLQNGEELADWIRDLTGRPCEATDLLWKPSRQARGVIVYSEQAIRAAEAMALTEQRRADRAEGRKVNSLRQSSKSRLAAPPLVLWGLQHNWVNAERSHGFSRITDEALPLAGGYNGARVWATPNSNKVAAAIAIRGCRTGLKTIVFVNKKADAVSAAAEIAAALKPVALNANEQTLMDAIALELGDPRHAIFGDSNLSAVPHNGSMLRLERKLAEDLFRRSTGAQTIVATPTLAQGLNLPAELAILAGDRRAGEDGKREDLEAHELLNAAARAGRAGHLANGVVILIPEPIITFQQRDRLTKDLQKALTSVLPENDRCLLVGDPLEVVLDRVMEGRLADRDVRYTINRIAALTASDGEAVSSGNFLVRSLAAFRARKRNEEQAYMAKVQGLWREALRAVADNPDPAVLLLASQSGMELGLLDRLRVRLLGDAGKLPVTVAGWLDWTLDWLKEDGEARADLLFEVTRAINTATGRKATLALDDVAVEALRAPAKAWIEGTPLDAIERLLGGDPDSTRKKAFLLPRAREFAGTIVPRALSFIVSVVARLVEELDLPSKQLGLSEQLLNSLAACVRRGFDSSSKLEFANANRKLAGRVETHRAYARVMQEIADQFGDL